MWPRTNKCIPDKTDNLPGQIGFTHEVRAITPYVPLPPCHTEGAQVFTLGKARIHAGGVRAKTVKNWGLVINLSGFTSGAPDVACYNGAEQICREFNQYIPPTKGYPEVAVDWPDGGIPWIKRKDWRRLISDLKQFDGDVLIHCMGGHGRTGTLLTILGSIGEVIDKAHDPVLWLRKTYCDKIVESYKQIDYLTKNMQIKTNAKPRYEFSRMTALASNSWPMQEQYDLTKPDTTDDTRTFECILCHCKKTRTLMFSVFQTDSSGFCYACHTASHLGGESGFY